jgi:hypothetical protein
MTNQRQFFQRPRLWGLLCGLTLAVALLFTPVGLGTVFLANRKVNDWRLKKSTLWVV